MARPNKHDVYRRLTPEEIATAQAANRAVVEAAHNAKPLGLENILKWGIGALIVALLATAFWAAGRIDKDCQRVPGGQGQTLNVCVDEHGNISDGDR